MILKDPLMLVTMVTRKLTSLPMEIHQSHFVFLSNFPQNFVLKDWFAVVIMGCSIQCDPAVLLSQFWLELSLNIADSEVN